MADALLDLRLHAARRPKATAVVCGSQRLNYAELEALANRLAVVVRDAGLVRGDHAVVVLGNRPDLLAMAWAAVPARGSASTQMRPASACVMDGAPSADYQRGERDHHQDTPT